MEWGYLEVYGVGQSAMLRRTIWMCIPNLHGPKSHLGTSVKMQILIRQVWGWAGESAFLVGFQAVLMLLVWGCTSRNRT